MQDEQSLPKELITQSPLRLARCSSERARALLTLERAEAIGVLPLAVVEHQGRRILAGAVAVGTRHLVTSALRFALNMESRLVEVHAQVFKQALVSAYKSDGKALIEAVVKHRQSATTPAKVIPFPRTADTSRLLFELLEHAVSQDASDLSLLPLHDQVEIRMKVQGELRRWAGPLLNRSVHERLVRAIKVLAQLDPNLVTLPLDGAFDGPAGLRVRVSTLPTVHGENVVLRLVGMQRLTLEELGFPAEHRERVERWIAAPNGLVIFAGATGSGKSSSLYGCMRSLVERGRVLTSIEDPVEQVVMGAVQCQVTNAMPFDAALRAMLRQAPDVIVVGEIRDAATAQVALRAASTGHLVLCSIHGGDVYEVFSRWQSFNIPEAQLLSCLRGIMVQRLLPRLCVDCRVSDLKAGGYRSVGCSNCEFSGYLGRMLVCESYEHPRGVITERGIPHLTQPHFVTTEEQLGRLRAEGLISLESSAVIY